MPNPKSDFEALYQDSLQLTSDIDDHGIPTLQRGIEQLDDASRILSDQVGLTARHDQDTALNKAHFLLAGRGFDADKLSRDLNTLELKASYEPLEPLGETDIEGYLRHHHDMIVVTAIEEAKSNTVADCDKRSTTFMLDEWESAKRKLLEDLGHRSGTYEKGSFRSPGRQRTREEASRKRRNEEEGPAGLGFGLPRLFASTTRVASKPQPSSDSIAVRSMLDEFMGQCVGVIRSMNKRRVPHSRLEFPVATHFVRLLESRTDSGAAATLRSWQALRCILSEADGQARCPLEMEYDEMYRSGSHMLKEKFADGARTHLEQQYRSYIQERVAKANGDVGGVPGLIPLVQQWVKLTQDNQAFLDRVTMHHGLPLWAQAYFCLRCGGADEALRLLRDAHRQGIASSDTSVVQHLRRKVISGKARILVTLEARQVLRSMYTRLTAARDMPIDPYQRAVANILGYVDPNASDAIVISNVEDFVWQRLCFCVPGSAAVSEQESSELRKHYSIDDVAQTIFRFGSTHFDPQGKNPMMYFHQLLLTQQFERAVEYLARHGLLVEAVHFAIVLYHYGVLYTPQNPKVDHDSMGVDRTSSSALLVVKEQGQPAGHPSLNFFLLIKQYIHRFSHSDPLEAIDYIVIIRDRVERMSLFKELVLDTRQFELLLGSIGPKGDRREGALGTYLPIEDVQEITTMAASDAERSAEYTDAIELYLCAGAICEVVSIYIMQLGQVLCPGHPARDFWVQKGIEFAESFCTESWVGALLAKEQSLAMTFQTLLNLSVFFDMYTKGEWEQSMHFIDSQRLIPASDEPSALSPAVMQFASLDESIRMNFYEVILAYMTCLYRLHEELKNTSGRVCEEKLQELKQRARAVVTYTGLIKFRLPEDVNARLTNMEVRMM